MHEAFYELLRRFINIPYYVLLKHQQNIVVPRSKQMVTCTTEVAIGAAVAVVATVIIECLIIGAPIIVALLCKFCLKRR